MPDRLVAVGDDFTLPAEILATLNIPTRQIVVHGADPNVARPNTTLPVVWFGTVDPVNSDDTKDFTVYGSEGSTPYSPSYGGGMVFAGSDPTFPRPTVPAGLKLAWYCTSQPINMADGDVYVPTAALA